MELCIILREEEKLPAEDSHTKIEYDCIDLWSKATRANRTNLQLPYMQSQVFIAQAFLDIL
jgi:hypothetical protein